MKAARHYGVIVATGGLMERSQGWDAQAFDERGNVKCVRWARTKAQAIAMVKAVMMPWSIRGLLCSKCNRGLGYIERFFGATANPDILLKVRDYLAARLKTA